MRSFLSEVGIFFLEIYRSCLLGRYTVRFTPLPSTRIKTIRSVSVNTSFAFRATLPQECVLTSLSPTVRKYKGNIEVTTSELKYTKPAQWRSFILRNASHSARQENPRFLWNPDDSRTCLKYFYVCHPGVLC